MRHGCYASLAAVLFSCTAPPQVCDNLHNASASPDVRILLLLATCAVALSVQALASPAWKSRHWETLSERMNLGTTIEPDEELTLLQLVDLDVGQHIDTIQEVRAQLDHAHRLSACHPCVRCASGACSAVAGCDCSSSRMICCCSSSTPPSCCSTFVFRCA